MPLKEKIVDWRRGTGNKKYRVVVKNKESGKTRILQFGDKRYGQFRDSTPLKLYSSKDHGDPKRRKAYFMRHSSVINKRNAIWKEEKKENIYSETIKSLW